MKQLLIMYGIFLFLGNSFLSGKESDVDYVNEVPLNDALFDKLRGASLDGVDFDGNVASVIEAVVKLLNSKKIGNLVIAFRGDRAGAMLEIMGKPAKTFFSPQLKRKSEGIPISAWDIILKLRGIEGGWVGVDGITIYLHLLNFEAISPEEEKRNLDSILK